MLLLRKCPAAWGFHSQKKLRDAKYEIDHGVYAKPDRTTVDSWYQVWMKEYRENIVQRTTIINNEKCYKHVKAEIGSMRLQAVRPEHIQRIFNKMKREGYSKGYIEKSCHSRAFISPILMPVENPK